MKNRRLLALILAMLMLLSLLAGCKNTEDQPDQTDDTTLSDKQTDAATQGTDSTDQETTEPETTEPEDTEPESSETTEATEGTESTEPATTEPDETKPTETEPTQPTGNTSGEKYSRAELEAMDTTKNGYGPGVQMDDQNRPYGALNEQKKYEQYDAFFIAPADGNFYLTFDEGYENGYTTKILDVLKEKNVKAVFFVTMPYCKSEPELVQRMIDEGHAVGNHSVNHKSMPTLSIDEMIDEVMGLHEYVKENFGYEMHLFRPPMGEYSEQSLAVLQNLGYKTVEWSFAYYDYDTENQMEHSKAYNKVISAAHSGGIFLLHAVSETNTAILGDVIDELRRQGYNLALLS